MEGVHIELRVTGINLMQGKMGGLFKRTELALYGSGKSFCPSSLLSRFPWGHPSQPAVGLIFP